MQSTRVKRQAKRGIIEEGGGEENKRKKPQTTYRRNVQNGIDLGGRRTKRRQESIGSVYVDPEYLENIKKTGRETQGAQDSSKNCRLMIMSPWSRLI